MSLSRPSDLSKIASRISSEPVARMKDRDGEYSLSQRCLGCVTNDSLFASWTESTLRPTFEPQQCTPFTGTCLMRSGQERRPGRSPNPFFAPTVNFFKVGFDRRSYRNMARFVVHAVEFKWCACVKHWLVHDSTNGKTIKLALTPSKHSLENLASKILAKRRMIIVHSQSRGCCIFDKL